MLREGSPLPCDRRVRKTPLPGSRVTSLHVSLTRPLTSWPRVRSRRGCKLALSQRVNRDGIETPGTYRPERRNSRLEQAEGGQGAARGLAWEESNESRKDDRVGPGAGDPLSRGHLEITRGGSTRKTTLRNLHADGRVAAASRTTFIRVFTAGTMIVALAPHGVRVHSPRNDHQPNERPDGRTVTRNGHISPPSSNVNERSGRQGFGAVAHSATAAARLGSATRPG